jgi:hypothetical protein
MTSDTLAKLDHAFLMGCSDPEACLDADIMVVPDAPDIFETFNEAGVFYGMDSSYTDRAHIIQPYIDKFGLAWPTGGVGG